MKELSINFKSENLRLFGVLHIPKEKFSSVIIHCHGLGGGKGFHHIKIAREFCKEGFGVLRFHFRCHGMSEGKQEDLTISGAIKDLKAAIDFINKFPLTKNKSIGVEGISFGGMIAILTALRNKRIKALAVFGAPLQIPFLTNKEVLKELKTKGFYQYRPWFKIGRRFFIDAKKYSKKIIRKITIPTLIVHGENDEEVDVKNAYEISKLCSKKKLVIIKSAGHQLKEQKKVLEQLINLELSWFKKWLK